MVVFKRKQIVALSLVLMIVIAGYLQYSYKKSSVSVFETEDVNSEPQLGEAVYVENNMLAEEDIADSFESSTEVIEKSDNINEILASKEANDFFLQAKLNREISRGKDKETLQEIAGNSSASNELKSQVNEHMEKLTYNSDMEMRIEALLQGKGFSDAVVLLASDGSLDIVVKAPTLSDLEVAQITNIASRQANIDIDKIYISKKY